MIDIHNYAKGLQNAENSIRKADIRQKNKDIIFKFEDHIITLGLSKPRILIRF